MPRETPTKEAVAETETENKKTVLRNAVCSVVGVRGLVSILMSLMYTRGHQQSKYEGRVTKYEVLKVVGY